MDYKGREKSRYKSRKVRSPVATRDRLQVPVVFNAVPSHSLRIGFSEKKLSGLSDSVALRGVFDSSVDIWRRLTPSSCCVAVSCFRERCPVTMSADSEPVSSHHEPLMFSGSVISLDVSALRSVGVRLPRVAGRIPCLSTGHWTGAVRPTRWHWRVGWQTAGRGRGKEKGPGRILERA